MANGYPPPPRGPWYPSEAERRRVQALAEKDREERERQPSAAQGFFRGAVSQLPAHAMNVLGMRTEPLPPNPRAAYMAPEVRDEYLAQVAARPEPIRARYEDYLGSQSDVPGFDAGRVAGTVLGTGLEYAGGGGLIRAAAKGLLPRYGATAVNALNRTVTPQTAQRLRSVVDPRTGLQTIASDAALYGTIDAARALDPESSMSTALAEQLPEEGLFSPLQRLAEGASESAFTRVPFDLGVGLLGSAGVRGAAKAAGAGARGFRNLDEAGAVVLPAIGSRVPASATRLPNGGIVAQSNLKSGPIASVREMEPDARLTAAQDGAHLKQNPRTGRYVGAPAHVISPQRLTAMRRHLDAQIAEGAEAGDWYMRSREGIETVAGRDPAEQSLLAQTYGFFSPQSEPSSNLQFALQARNAYEAGAPLDIVRTGRQGREYAAARAEGRPLSQGPKTGPFAEKLDPTLPVSDIPVNDFRMFQIFGYTNPQTGKPWTAGGTQQMHAFVDAEMLLAAERANVRQLGGRTDWNAASVQAAPWVVSKQKALMRRAPRRYPDTDEGRAAAWEQANKEFTDYYSKYAGSMTYEMVPGRYTGHMEGVSGAGLRERGTYSTPRRWYGDDRRDIIYDALGFHQLPGGRARGYYTNPQGELEVNPAFTARPLLDRATGLATPSPRTSQVVNLAEQTRGLLGAQHDVAWHQPISDLPGGQQTSISIDLNRPLSQREITQLVEVGKPLGLEPIDTGLGVTMIQTGEGLNPAWKPGDEWVTASSRDVLKGLRGDLQSEVRRILPDAGAIERIGTAGDYFSAMSTRWPEGRGTATRNLLANVNRVRGVAPNVPGQLADPRIRAHALKLRDLDELQAGGLLGTPRQDLQNFRTIFGQNADPWKALQEALRAGVPLPVVAGLLGSYSMSPTRRGDVR